MENEISVQSGSLKELTESVAQQLAAGVDRDALTRSLVERGWPERAARRFVAGVRAAPAAVAQRQRARHERWRIARGLLLLALGAAVIAAGLALGDPSGSLFVFSAGVILSVFGLLDFLSGISAWSSTDR